MFRIALTTLLLLALNLLAMAESIPVWPDLAPGETSRATGENQPFRKNENPPVTRTINIRLPTMDVFPAANPFPVLQTLSFLGLVSERAGQSWVKHRVCKPSSSHRG